LLCPLSRAFSSTASPRTFYHLEADLNMSEAPGKSVLLVGATGQVGSHLLQELLASSQFSHVGEYGRRVTPEAKITAGKEKLEQRVIDFENLSDAELRAGKWDTVFITLGTSRKSAGGAAAFEKIDREYVINVARAAKSEDPTHVQRLVYVSSQGADPSSYLLYFRSKGLTELALASMGYSETIVLRPGLLTEVNRENTTLKDTIARSVHGVFSSVFSFSHSAASVSLVAKAAAIAGSVGVSGLPASIETLKLGRPEAPFVTISNFGILSLADAFKKG